MADVGYGSNRRREGEMSGGTVRFGGLGGLALVEALVSVGFSG